MRTGAFADNPTGAPHARYSEQERLDQRQNADDHHCFNRSRPCDSHGWTVEHRACCEQSRTQRNARIDGGGSDPAAGRRAFGHDHGSRALTLRRHRMAGNRRRMMRALILAPGADRYRRCGNPAARTGRNIELQSSFRMSGICNHIEKLFADYQLPFRVGPCWTALTKQY